MLRAADAVGRFVAGKAVGDLVTDELLRSGIYYQLFIIGEALTQIRRTEPGTAEGITEYDRVIGFRNQIAHGYAKPDDEITWRVIETKLPVLRADVKRLLDT